MNLAQLFAHRYLFSKSSRSVVHLISGVSVVAVAMPVAAMIILLSVFNGFERLVRDTCTVFDAEWTITPDEGATFAVDRIDTTALTALPEVGALSFVLEQSALVNYRDRQAVITVRGVDDAYDEVLDWRENVTRGDSRIRIGDWDRAILGQAMIWQLGIHSLTDTDIELYAVRRGHVPSLIPTANYNSQRVRVGGVFELDLESERSQMLVPLRLARTLFDYPDQASALLVRMKPGSDPTTARKSLQTVVGEDFQIRNRHELRASFYRMLTYEKWGIFFISLLVLIIASFSIVGSVTMLIVEKRRDIATLRALGGDNRLVRSIFRAEGLLICLWGAVIGVAIGLTATLMQQYFGLIEIPAESFLTKSYPVEFRWGDLAVVLASFAGVAYLFSDLTVRALLRPADLATEQPQTNLT